MDGIAGSKRILNLECHILSRSDLDLRLSLFGILVASCLAEIGLKSLMVIAFCFCKPILKL